MKRTRNFWLLIAAILVLAGFLGGILARQAMAQAKGPADFEFDGKGSGKVTFSHEKHVAKNPKCTDCHTKIFKMAKGQRSAPKMAEMQQGAGMRNVPQRAGGVRSEGASRLRQVPQEVGSPRQGFGLLSRGTPEPAAHLMVFAAGSFFGDNTVPDRASRSGHAAGMTRSSPGRMPTALPICR